MVFILHLDKKRYLIKVIKILYLLDDSKIIDITKSKILDDFCQFLEIPLIGKEGILQEEIFKLRGLLVLFRHGER